MIGKRISHYRILEKIGGGGMGVVYKVEDTKLDRAVALKFLPQEFTDDAKAKSRFIQEARAASSLDHPNICTIHDIGETEEGRLFIAMAYYEGETLEKKAERGPLQLNEASSITLGIARGLSRAHAKGIIHRDIKSANVFVTTDGQIKILDFGLAKLAGTTRITKKDSITGTIAYMSPEMVNLENIDHRTDIWSLGVVLYEMLTGQLPFSGENWGATLFAIANNAPKPIHELREDVPLSLERITMRMLQKNPQDRYNKMEDMITDLQNVGTGAKTSFIYPMRKPSASIAVLPFLDMSSRKDQEYFCDGIAEEIINSLTHIKDLRVVARTSAFSFKGRDVDVREIGRKLNVDHILEGSVRKSGNQLRITAQLVNVTDGYHLWSERFDREAEDVFTVQDEISLKIVDKLKVGILGEEKTALHLRQTSNIEAYHSYLKGRFFSQRLIRADMEKAVKYYEQAIEHDPQYARAYAAMAQCYCTFGLFYYLPSKDAFREARAAVKKALEIEGTLAIANGTMGLINYLYDWDFDNALQKLQRAIELDPNCIASRSNYAGYLSVVGKMDSAIEEVKRALELDPLSVNQNVILGLYYIKARQSEKARQQLLKTLEFSTDHPWVLWLLATTYALDLQYDKGIKLLKDALKGAKGYAPIIAALGWFQAMNGDKTAARKILQELHEKAKESYIWPYLFAKIHAAIGENDMAFQWFERAYQERDCSLSHILTDESVDCIRTDPRFDELLKKVGLYAYKQSI
jgi:serine/threonine protein kinase/Tfp pilus assembly protein PilF